MAEPHYLPNGALADPVVLMDPTTGAAYAASGGGSGGGGAVTLVDGADVTQGASTDTAASLTVMGRILKLIALLPTGLGQKLSAASLGVVIASDQSAVPVNGTVTTNVGTGTRPISVVDGGNTALGSTGDVSSGSTVVALLKNIKAALAGTLTISGAVTNSNLDVALSTRLKPADTLAGVTTVAAVTAITNPLPAGTNAIGVVGLKSQTSATVTLQSAATAAGNGSVMTTDGYNGALQLLISNGAGTCTINIEGSLDNFATAQDVVMLGVYKLSDSAAGTNASRTVISGGVPVAANTSYLYAIADTYPYVRARITGATSLGAGTSVTGCTAKLYGVPA